MTDREKAIKTLEDIIAISDKFKEDGIWAGLITINADKIKSLKFALESIKVDRAYDLAYEKVDFIEIPEGATNGDMIKALFPECELYQQGEGFIEFKPKGENWLNCFRKIWWNSPYRKEQK